jgi:hypothetical protein
MGFNFAVRGWYTVPSPSPGLADAAATAFAKRDEWHPNPPKNLFTLFGARENEMAFGTESTRDAYYYLLFLRDVAALTPEGFGLVTVNGELMEGRERIAVCHGGHVRLVSLEETYKSPWLELVNACFDADYAHARAQTADGPASRGAHLPRACRVRGWLEVAYADAANLEKLGAELEEQSPALRHSVGAMNHLSRPHLLIATGPVEPSEVLSAVTELTTMSPGTAGVVYVTADERVFHPFFLSAGSAHPLPFVSLRRPDGSEHTVWNERSFVGLREPPDARPEMAESHWRYSD